MIHLLVSLVCKYLVYLLPISIKLYRYFTYWLHEVIGHPCDHIPSIGEGETFSELMSKVAVCISQCHNFSLQIGRLVLGLGFTYIQPNSKSIFLVFLMYSSDWNKKIKRRPQVFLTTLVLPLLTMDLAIQGFPRGTDCEKHCKVSNNQYCYRYWD